MRYVVVGGGITGLVAARLLKEKLGKHSEVFLIEKSMLLGGLLNTYHDPDAGDFDFGVHTIYETDSPELNNLLVGLLPEDEWHINAGVKRDFGGSYYRGKLQSHSAYVDLRSLPEREYQRAVDDFFTNLATDNSGLKPQSAAEALRRRYGDFIAKHVMAPILAKALQFPAENLHPFAARLLPLDRVVMFNQPAMDELIASTTLRAHLAYPDQSLLPAHLLPNKRSYYPRQYGMFRVVDALAAQLVACGVKILTGVGVNKLSLHNGKVDSIEIQKHNEVSELDNLAGVLWTCGIPPLAAALGLKRQEEGPLDEPLQTSVVNLLLDRPDTMQGMFYAYCLEPGFKAHRLASPYSLCPASKRHGGFPFAIELIHSRRTNQQELAAIAISEAKSMGAIPPDARVNWQKIMPLPGGYPTLSVRNVAMVEGLRQQISTLGLKGLKLMGMMAREDLFYQADILVDAYKQIMEI